MSRKYFTTKEYCSCPLDSVDPEKIKNLYSSELKKEDIKRTRYYNLAANALGAQNWSQYLVEYSNQLVPFLEKHGLTTYAQEIDRNILKSQNIRFSYRQISDRLFLSPKETPQAIFTGYGCETEYISHYVQFGSSLSVEEMPKKYLFNTEAYYGVLSATAKDLLIPLHVSEFMPLHNLLGDLFVKYENVEQDDFVAMLYQGNQGLIEQETYIQSAKALKTILLEMDKGWIKVIPYNDNLIFLKADDGTYDFLFRNLRETPFISPYGKYINQKNIPSLLNESYDFSRWCYYGFKEQIKNLKNINVKSIWKERDEHLAEIAFYEKDDSSNYPGQLEILKDFYNKSGDYKYSRKTTSHIIEGFNRVEMEKSTLCVSQLITIGEFIELLEDDYRNERPKTLEDLESVNLENQYSPASVTWYDAVVYCQWLVKKHNVPFRLLTKEELDSFAPKFIDNDPVKYNLEQDLEFYYNHEKLPSPPPYMGGFEQVIMKNAKAFEYLEQHNVRFPTSRVFREWTNDYRDDLADTFSIRSTGNDMYDKGIETRYLASSNNKYKYKKIGFRVCYEIQKDTAC